MRSLTRLVTVMWFALFAFIEANAAYSVQVQEQSGTATISGRLATVEPAERRLTILPLGEVNLFEFFLAQHGAILQDKREITLADLVIHVGRRVMVTYRIENDRRVADSVTVEAGESARPLALAMPPTRLP